MEREPAAGADGPRADAAHADGPAATVREAAAGGRSGRETLVVEMQRTLARIDELSGPGDGELRAACRELVAAAELREELAEDELARRLGEFVRIHEAVVRLRERGSVEAIIAGAPEAVADACDFDRVVIFRVDESIMVAEAFYHRGDPDRARRLLAHSREHPVPLQEQFLETEMVRRRRPMVVHDTFTHPSTYKPLIEVYGTYSYVAAPIMPEGRVIGFVHADKGVQFPRHPRAVDEFDRDLLWGFAEGLGHAIERLGLVERMQAQSHDVRRLIARAAEAVDEYVGTRVELVSTADDGGGATTTARAILAERDLAPTGTPLARLTRRELEVLRLVAAGATNAQVASRLVITVGTAKSHMARILRKLGASNRVEAVTTYLRSRPGDGGGGD
ncbi:MAG: LuxR C-terminal-related transcriptional regulator [Solirubrobacteraceae bacterium]